MAKRKRVKLNADARADLRAIGDFIAEDNPRRAVTFVRELREACDDLDQWPERYPLVGLRKGDPSRRRVYGNYSIFYEIVGDQIWVLRIVNAARDTTRLFPDA